MLDGLALGHLEPLHDARQPLAAEDAKERVLERQVEARRTRVALPARPSPKLVVDASRFMPLGADDVQAPGGDDRIMANLPFGAELRDLLLLVGRR